MRRLAALVCSGILALCASPAAASTPWRNASPPGPLTSIAFANIAGSTRVYAKSAAHYWRSDDAGATWATVAGGPYPSSCDLRVSPADADVVYTGCGSVSGDAGAHWSGLPAIEGTPQIDAAGTLYWIAPNDRQVLHRCAAGGSPCASFPVVDSWGFTVDQASAGVLVSYPGGSALTMSSDGGTTWSAPRALPADLLGAGVSFDGRTPRKLVAVGQNATPVRVLSVSLDAGLTWSPRRVVPLPDETYDNTSALSGGTGSLRRTWLQSSHDAAWTADSGVTFHVVHLPFLYGLLSVDPNDGTHLFLGDGTRLLESHDSGGSWTLRNAARFGPLRDSLATLSGSGSTLSGLSGGVAFVSRDAGLTWTIPGDLMDAKVTGLVASRDDPRVAYASGSIGNVAGFWQTLDGGQTWTARTVPPPGTFATVGWIEPGHPDWVFMGSTGGLPVTTSHDGGATWFEEPFGNMCLFTVTIDANQSRGKAGCGPLFAVDPLRAPWDQPFDMIEHVLVYQASGVMVGTSILGRVNADWSFDSACAPTTRPGTCTALVSYSNVRTDAWVAGGQVTYAYADGQSLWAKREGGRWWRLVAPPGSDEAVVPGPLVLLSPAQLIANGLLVPLEAPDVGVPKLSLVSGPLHCGSTVLADVADLAYVWKRDGAVVSGTTADHTIVPADEGHALSCSVTASNSWGSATADSASYRVTVTGAAARTRLALTGLASTGRVLRCGAAARISWLRDGRVLKGRHARTYRIGAGDEGHTLACQTRRADGTIARSLAVRVPKARGGPALPVRP